MKKIFTFLIIILLVIGLVFLTKKLFEDKEVEANNIAVSNNIEIISNTVPDEEKDEEIKYIKLSNDDKVGACSILGTFENGKDLTTEQYLKVASNALSSGYIKSDKTTYTENEINNIIYSIFDVKINGSQSVEGLSYSNGIYTLEKKGNAKANIEVLENGTAAGSVYSMYILDGKTYIAKLTTNGVTGENYVSSVIENN